MSGSARLACRLEPVDCLRADLPVSPLAWLSPGESQRLAGFGSARRRDIFLAGRWLLRLALIDWHDRSADPAAWRCEIDAQGRSSLPAEPLLSLSLSHSGDWLACAIATSPVGLDIESLQRARDFSALASQLMSPLELADFQALPAAERPVTFYRWWTLREAWLKRRGLGLDLACMRRLVYESAAPGSVDAAVFVDEARGLVLALDSPALAGTDVLELGDSRLEMSWRLKSRLAAHD